MLTTSHSFFLPSHEESLTRLSVTDWEEHVQRMSSEPPAAVCAAVCPAEVGNGKLWCVPISLSPCPSPLSSSDALSTHRKCICLNFLWICKIETRCSRAASLSLPSLHPVHSSGLLSCLNKQKNFKKAIFSLVKTCPFLCNYTVNTHVTHFWQCLVFVPNSREPGNYNSCQYKKHSRVMSE